MTSRERMLITILLDSQVALTAKDLARKLDVSVRTIHRDLKSVETLVQTFHMTLIKKSGTGLIMKGTKENKAQLYKAIEAFASHDYTPEERQIIIITTLLATKTPVKLYTLANDLKVTIATISHDLDVIESQLQTHQLSTIRKRGYGVHVTGEETNKRQAISFFITKYIDPFALMNEGPTTSINTNHDISNRLLEFVQPERLKVIEQAVEQIKSHLPYDLADNAYVALIVHLALAIERLKNDEHIHFDTEYLQQLSDKKEFHIAKTLLHQLEKTMGIAIPDEEIGYITMHLLGAKLNADQHYIIEDSAMDIAHQAKAFIQYVNEALDVQLDQSPTLLNDLVAHLKPALYRMKKGMHITNPMMKQIKSEYASLFHLLKKAATETFPTYTFPDDEIGYLVLHVGAVLFYETSVKHVKALVVCASGIGTSKMLATQLQQRFAEITEIEVISMFELKDIQPSKYDLILSTVTLGNMNMPYTMVSPILTQHEEKKIKHKLRTLLVTHRAMGEPIQTTEKGNPLKKLHDYTGIALQFVQFCSVNKLKTAPLEKILHRICHDLMINQYLHDDKTIIQKLLNREQMGGMGIPNSTLALYHTRSKDVIQPFLSIYRLDGMITVEGMQGTKQEIDTIFIMFAPEQAAPEALELLSYVSSLLVQEPTSLSIFTTGSEESVKQYIYQQLLTLIKNKNII